MTDDMLIIKKPDDRTLRSIAAALKRGAVVVYPTDTAYALGCDATNAAAVRRIYKIKGRHFAKAMPMICADLTMVRRYFFLTTHDYQLATRHWPGPLSTVVKAKKNIARAVLSRGTAAVRVPDLKIARILSKFLGRPLVATSANASGRPACYSVKAVVAQFNGRTPPTPSFPKRGAVITPPFEKGRVGRVLFLDAGALPRRRPSTIVKIGKDGSISVLRKGPVSFDIRH